MSMFTSVLFIDLYVYISIYVYVCVYIYVEVQVEMQLGILALVYSLLQVLV